jgi:hypothetical protein
MAATLNLHKLFATDTGYLKALSVPEDDEKWLRVAREAIRATLRGAFADWERWVARTELFEGWVLKSNVDVRLPQPKFRLQGSFAYHTVNDCQQNPPQQIDQDDGVFLPMSFVSNGGKTRPSVVSKAYFAIVERALGPLCQKNGWELNPGRAKNTCVRVQIDDRLHIDLPLYAIRDEAFQELVEAAARTSVLKAFDARNDIQLAEDVYRNLLDADIVLAHRTEGWIESDPRKLERWFERAIEIYGPQVRRLARAYKGLRDAHWAECGLGSICIMAAVVTAVEQIERQDPLRDDLALLAVGRKLIHVLSGPIENPAFPGESDKCLCKDWEPGFREQVQQVIANACDKLERAIHDTLHKEWAVQLAREAFGPRVPADADLVRLVGVAEVIRKVEPTPQKKSTVPRTESG